MKKRITASFLLGILVACSNTAQVTLTTVPTLDGQASPIGTEVGPALPAVTPPPEETAPAISEPEEILNPQGTPMQEWRGVPIMPEAIAGQELSGGNSYSFRVNTSAKEVQDFYSEKLAELGWSQPFNTPFDAAGGTMTFRREGLSLGITVMSSEGSVVVLLMLTLA